MPKKIFGKKMAFLLGVLMMMGIWSSPGKADAATFACDNDAASYYNCSNYNSFDNAWSKLNSGLNNDSRYTTSWGRMYGWVTDYNLSPRTYYLRVYLANGAFNNPYAEYGSYQLGGNYTSNYINDIDQNTAISGWNYVGSTYLDSYARTEINVTSDHRYDSVTYGTGADGIELYY